MQNQNIWSSDVRKWRSPILIGIGIIVMLFLVACADATEHSTAEETQESQLPANVALALYQDKITSSDREAPHLSDLLAEGRPVVLNFWAGLCPSCRLEMPDLQATH